MSNKQAPTGYTRPALSLEEPDEVVAPELGGPGLTDEEREALRNEPDSPGELPF